MFTARSFLSQMVVRPQARYFAAGAQITIDDLKSVADLQAIGVANLEDEHPHGLDYDKLLNSKKFGVKNQAKTFKSFEDEINKNFNLAMTEPVSRDSKRVGLMGYKMGMTHFWDKWGKLTPCTVVQVDRCQVTQVKTKERDGVDAI